MDFDTIIVGAGACGLMCAVQAGYLGKNVLLLEKNDKPGAKILISGGGRCNYTNTGATEEQFITQNPHFLKSIFSQWTVEDTIQFFETYGIVGQEKTLGQLFPLHKTAKEVLAVFTSLCHSFNQTIWCDTEVKKLDKVGDNFVIEIFRNQKYETITCKKVVITSGGLPIPKMGATDFALRLAKQNGLKVIETAPALVPLTITGKDENWFAQLAGNTLFSKVKIADQCFEENLLFTHWGLSGPAILQISSYWRKGDSLWIDLLPNKAIQVLLNNQRQQNGKMQTATFLNQFFTKKLSDALGKFLPLHKPIANLTKTDMQLINNTIHCFTLKPAGDKGYAKAEVMRGGIDTTELWQKTLEAKKVPGMYFGGECVDVTGWLGGYNFQWAWASAYVIAQAI